MTFPNDFTTVTQDVIDALGEVVSHTPDGGGAVTSVNALFDRLPSYADDFEGGSLVYETLITVKSSDASLWAVGDTLTARSISYEIMTLEPDEYGSTQCRVTTS